MTPSAKEHALAIVEELGGVANPTLTAEEVARIGKSIECHILAAESQARAEGAEAECAEMRKVLKSVEWLKASYPFLFCPSCRSAKDDGHNNNCELAKALDSSTFGTRTLALLEAAERLADAVEGFPDMGHADTVDAHNAMNEALAAYRAAQKARVEE